METNENPYEEYNQYADSGFEWQEECLSEIQDKNNVIISSPTGSGKTRVFLEWAKGKDNFYEMLQFRKYVMSLPKEYIQGLTKVTDVIRKIDITAIEGYRGKVSTQSISESRRSICANKEY